MSHEQPIIEFDRVSFAYDRSTPVIKEVSFSIQDARAVCIIGPNGTGKTTLCLLMLGLRYPQSGHIHLLGMRPEQARLQAGYVPQATSIDPLFPATVLDIVLMGNLAPGAKGGYTRSERGYACEILESCGLAEQRNQPFAQLSGGMKQRTLIARALVCQPKILIMDEPLTSIDPAAEAALLEIFNRLQEKMVVVMVSHQFEFVSNYVEQVICMHNNQQVHVHPTESVSQENLSTLYGSKFKRVAHETDLN